MDAVADWIQNKSQCGSRKKINKRVLLDEHGRKADQQTKQNGTGRNIPAAVQGA